MSLADRPKLYREHLYLQIPSYRDFIKKGLKSRADNLVFLVNSCRSRLHLKDQLVLAVHSMQPTRLLFECPANADRPDRRTM